MPETFTYPPAYSTEFRRLDRAIALRDRYISGIITLTLAW